MVVVTGHIRWKYRHRRTFLATAWWCAASWINIVYLRPKFAPPDEFEPIVPFLPGVVTVVAGIFFSWELIALARWRPSARWLFSACLKFWSLMLFGHLIGALWTRSWSPAGEGAAVLVLALNGGVNSLLHSPPHELPWAAGRGAPCVPPDWRR
jgi:hypothetical protein